MGQRALPWSVLRHKCVHRALQTLFPIIASLPGNDTSLPPRLLFSLLHVQNKCRGVFPLSHTSVTAFVICVIFPIKLMRVKQSESCYNSRSFGKAGEHQWLVNLLIDMSSSGAAEGRSLD